MKDDITLPQIAKDTGDKLIDISLAQADQMQKWSDEGVLPEGMSPTECLGFINKPNAGNAINMVLDLQVPASATEATLRIWAITSEENDRHDVLFNNIQLNFRAGLGFAKVLAMKGANFSREDIRTVLHDAQTQLKTLTISVQSGASEAIGQKAGQRYELSPVDGQDGVMHDAESNKNIPLEEIQHALANVLSTFESTVRVQ